MGTSKGYSPPTGHLWSEAKRAVSSMNRNNYSSNSIEKAVSSFSKASQSNRSQGNVAISNSSSKVLGFADLVTALGLDRALDEIGLQHLKGQEPQKVFEGLIDYFSEGTNSLQQSIADQALQEYMTEMMGNVRSNEELQSLFSELDANTMIQDILIKYVQVSFFTNFAEKINTLCENITQAIKMQERIKQFIRLEISENYKKSNLERMDWNGTQGRKFVQEKCEEIWGIFEQWEART
ncbi:hypothetical protein QCD85_13200 [Paenibacillus sp. PsM32]|uniref:hypothetical protein n=1 Tax=Paenibacillus sp. PsM32 TaxID=3030536 RepID=UPI00263B8403|nr:hypothetical protein [Paenibacillus sp. PsM32]MDN4619056.1 hypothetical protein [Paenibacillus sp. PsM32]